MTTLTTVIAFHGDRIALEDITRIESAFFKRSHVVIYNDTVTNTECLAMTVEAFEYLMWVLKIALVSPDESRRLVSFSYKVNECTRTHLSSGTDGSLAPHEKTAPLHAPVHASLHSAPSTPDRVKVGHSNIFSCTPHHLQDLWTGLQNLNVAKITGPIVVVDDTPKSGGMRKFYLIS